MKLLIVIAFLLQYNLLMAQQAAAPLPSGYKPTCAVVENKIVLVKPQVQPVFPGGKKICNAFFARRFNRKMLLQKGARPGNYKVFIRMIVQSDGSYCDIMPESSNGFGIEEEAIRILLQTPRWTPAQQEGKPADAYYRLGITVTI